MVLKCIPPLFFGDIEACPFPGGGEGNSLSGWMPGDNFLIGVDALE